MTLSETVRDAGEDLASATIAQVPDKLNAAIAAFAGWPYSMTSAAIVDAEGNSTDAFASVIYAGETVNPERRALAADSAAAVIDVSECLDLEALRAAYDRITAAKQLKKSPAPHGDVPTTNVTLGVIYAHSTRLPLEELAAELERLNAVTPGAQWPDMVAVANIGTIQYAVQFPGEGLSGDFLPPAEGALEKYAPPMYVVMTLRPTGDYTFNKMLAFIFAHLAIFSPGARLPNWSEILTGMPQTAVTLTGYQYNLAGELKPVPREFYNDRYFPPPPLRIETQKGNLLSTIQFLPWHDGGVVIMRGKLRLEGIMVFFGKNGVERGGTVPRPPDLQISYVLPINAADFREAMMRFQQQSNMLVKSGQGSFVIQKVADEGTNSPFMARIFLGIIRLRDIVYTDSAKRDVFDKHYDFVNSSLVNARSTAQDIQKLWVEHSSRVSSGEIARIDGRSIRIDENIDKALRKEVESFLNAAVRALKQGMQTLATELQADIGFLFKKQTTFEAGIEALRGTDPILANYLEQVRTWSEFLVQRRNHIEHTGWTLPRIAYAQEEGGVKAQEPLIGNQPFTVFIPFMLDRLCCFVEEFTAYRLQRLMAAEITIREIPLAERPAEIPERFQVTLAHGGHTAWKLAYHANKFEDS